MTVRLIGSQPFTVTSAGVEYRQIVHQNKDLCPDAILEGSVADWGEVQWLFLQVDANSSQTIQV